MLESAQLALSLVPGLVFRSPDGNRGESIAVLRGSPRSSPLPSGGVVEVMAGMVDRVMEGIVVGGVEFGIVIEGVVVGMKVEGVVMGMTV